MPKKANRTVTMPTACWHSLREMLAQSGWATTPKVIVTAGNLALRLDREDGSIKIAPIPKTITPETERAWAQKPIKADLDSREQDVIEKCIQHHIEKGAFGGNVYAKQLIEEFLDVS